MMPSRGIKYNVDKLNILPGLLQAEVMRSGARRPQIVELTCPQWSEEEWEQVLKLFASQASHAAQIMNGAIADATMQELDILGINLIPPKQEWLYWNQELLQTDGGGVLHSILPHLAVTATENPLLLFELRGMKREKWLQKLRERRSLQSSQFVPAPAEVTDKHKLVDQELPVKPLLSLTGNPSFWSKDRSLEQVLKPVYEKVSQRAEQILQAASEFEKEA